MSSNARTRSMVLMFTDVVGSVAMKTRLGTGPYTDHLRRHDALFRRVMADCEGAEVRKDLGDGFLARFPSAAAAVSTALRFQHELSAEAWPAEPVRVRVGLDLGDVTEMDEQDEGRAKLVGLAADMAARVMGLALPGQVLMTAPVFDAAREEVQAHPATSAGDAPELRWIAHGPYLMHGADETTDVYEVGANGVAPLRAPPDSEKARRAVPAGEEELYGWRPAVGLPVPGRLEWVLERRLGEGGFGEVWLARHAQHDDPLVFKFCFDAERLRSLRRELAIFRLVRESLGEREDIARIIDVQVDRPPFYLESEFTEQGNLVDWAESQSGIESVPLARRLELMAEIADAVGAAHSVGILHKDIKPSNVLVYDDEHGTPHPRLADFGIGAVMDTSRLLKHDITVVGFTETMSASSESTMAGTRMYAPPETLAGMPFTLQGDVFALGVMLYQMVVADLRRPIGQGWERAVDDPLLCDDIGRCIELRPSERLASAGELAERLRTLDARRAERDAGERREALAVRRQRRMRVLGIGVSVLIVLLGVVGWMFVQEQDSRREAERLRKTAETERERAVAAKKRALAVSGFLNVDLLGAVDPRTAQGRDVTMREVLDIAAASIEGRFDDQPDVEGELRQTIGRVYLGLGLYPEARMHLDRALALRTSSDDKQAVDVAETLESLAVLESSGGDNLTRALDLARRVVEIREAALGAEHALTIRAQADVGMYAALAEGKLAAGIDNPGLLGMLAKVRNRGESIDEMRAVLIRMIHEGERLWRAGDREGLVAYAEQVAQPFYENEVFAERVPWAWSSFALYLQRDNRPVAAEALAIAAIETGTKRLGEGHPNVIHAHQLMATVLHEQERLEDALPFYAKAADLRAKQLGEGHRRTLGVRFDYVVALVELGRYAQAEPLALRMRALYEANEKSSDDDIRDAALLLATLYEHWGKPEKSAEWREKAGG